PARARRPAGDDALAIGDEQAKEEIDEACHELRPIELGEESLDLEPEGRRYEGALHGASLLDPESHARGQVRLTFPVFGVAGQIAGSVRFAQRVGAFPFEAGADQPKAHSDP